MHRMIIGLSDLRKTGLPQVSNRKTYKMFLRAVRKSCIPRKDTNSPFKLFPKTWSTPAVCTSLRFSTGIFVALHKYLVRYTYYSPSDQSINSHSQNN